MTTFPPPSSPSPAPGTGPTYGQPSPAPQWAESQSSQSPLPGPQDPAPQAAAPHAPAPGTDLSSDLGAALKFSGNALLRNPVAYLVSGLIYFVVMMLIIVAAVVVPMMVLFGMLTSTPASQESPGAEILLIYGLMLLFMLPLIPLMLLWQTGAARSAEVVLQGGRPTIGQDMVGPMRIFLTALLVGAIALIGSLLLYIPGLIASVLLFYAIPAAVKGASPVEALKQSVALVRANLGSTIVAWLVMLVISNVAGMFVLPVIVVIPFYVLFQMGMFERLNGRELPEPAQA